MLLLIVPGSRKNFSITLNILLNPVFLREPEEVLFDFVTVAVETGLFRIRLERIGIDVGWNIARATRIFVLEPRSSNLGVLLVAYQGEVLEKLFGLVRKEQPRCPRANVDDLELLRCALRPVRHICSGVRDFFQKRHLGGR